ncbi:dihydropteroate synthase [Marivivens niveibacter]|uniref:Dihydropteroate synthase n=1 Tax=Marivivens niveibacter TaxID=1930667 RepID=A0A251X101_9RHOB|nr:dihydropteroate synthase [Marivivens niveibacter]OUD10410.1 dihydropteroate synthase [Marivivens niveibacter]
MTTQYFRPIPMMDAARPASALTIAGGWCWFDRVEVLERGRKPQIISDSDVPQWALDAITAPRADIAGLSLAKPQMMGILNVTPDSFSDGGQFDAPVAALAQAAAMAEHGASIIDIGGESTRPGAVEVAVDQEIERTQGIIAQVAGTGTVVSIDTRKAPVAKAAADAGALILNDVSAMEFDPEMSNVAAQTQLPICLMHAQGLPEFMQDDPRYDDVLLDVYDYLAGRIDAAVAAGVDRSRIITDPGIGFGKTKGHNLALLRRLSLFHTLGCPILLGASRKRFIGEISNAQDAAERASGSVSVALDGIRHGVQIVRVHDTLETKQALSLMFAVNGVGHDS